MAGSLGKILLSILAIILPPIAALIAVCSLVYVNKNLICFVKDGCSLQFCLNILLTLLGILPGIIHALWLIWAHRPEN